MVFRNPWALSSALAQDTTAQGPRVSKYRRSLDSASNYYVVNIAHCHLPVVSNTCTGTYSPPESSPEGHDILSLGIDPNGEVPNFPHFLHLLLAGRAVHVPPEPGVVLQLLPCLKLSAVTHTGLLCSRAEHRYTYIAAMHVHIM